MKIDYACFYDVVCFDTTYNTNKYEIPFAPIVGVDNHQWTVIFVSVVVSDETIKHFCGYLSLIYFYH